jgi:rod shape-determining protein MreD
MRPLSTQILSFFPPLLGLLLLFIAATPFDLARLSLTPNVAWLMTLTVIAVQPAAWPRGFAFALGLLQDIFYATPLGTQALLTLLLVQLAQRQARQAHANIPFRLRWLEAAGLLMLFHLLLWALIRLISTSAPTLGDMMRAGIVDALWFPFFYIIVTRLFGALGDTR